MKTKGNARKFLTNDEIMGLFIRRDQIKEDLSLSEAQRKKEADQIDNQIIESLGFLVFKSTRYYKKFPNYSDLTQEGYIGLVKATRRFNYKLFPNFFVYAERWIRHRIRRSASRFDIIYSPVKTRVVYTEASSEATKAANEEIALDAGPEEYFIAQETAKQINLALEEFAERDSDIVKRVFGLNDYCPQTLREIGSVYNLTHERVRQIKNEVVERLSKSEALAELY